MTEQAERWRLVEELCQEALERPASERDGFLRGACQDDDLRQEVERLLAQESAADRFLETTVGAAAASVMPTDSQPLLGRRLGPFAVGPLLGAGGMGEVYRAHDVNLHRDVAIKILPLAFALDPDRLTRFKREAQVLASLNHPNIAAIYGFEHANNVEALVLELVEGPTLADRIAHGPIPPDEAVPIARQIAEGLEAAHEHGIVHRDLKPANIKLRPDGTVKVLDFGLAKVLQTDAFMNKDPGASPTITGSARTAEGVFLGTAAYVSPEQARGREADKRSDVWAFGAVLYEMLSGQRAFKGDDVFDTLSAVMRQDVAWTALPASTPASLRRLMARCLDRDVRHRLRDIGEARIALEDPEASSVDGVNADIPSVPVIALATPPRTRWQRAVPVALAAMLTGAVAGTAWYLKSPTPHEVIRLSFDLPEGQSLSSGDRSVSAISPDGTQIVYVAGGLGLYLHSMSALDAKPIRGTEGNVNVGEPVFSPDSQSIVFATHTDNTLRRVPVTGGAPVTICRAEFAHSVSWGDDGILFVDLGKGIMRVPPTQTGGSAALLIPLHDGEAVQSPQMLPGGQHLLFTLATGTAPDRWDRARIVVQSLVTGERKTLFEGGSDARYVPTGHLVYAVGGSLFAVAFDLQALQVTGAAVPMIDGVRRSAASFSGGAHFSFANNGSLIYVPGPPSALWDLALTDPKGGVERLKLDPGPYEAPRISPDGKRIAFGTDDGKEAIVYTFPLSGATGMTRLTYEGHNRFPTWSSDSRRVAFQSDRDGDAAIFWQPADGGPPERLTTPGPGESHEPESWSPNADTLLFSVTKGSDVSLWMLSPMDRKPTPFGNVHSSKRIGAVFSPDGRWVAYSSSEGPRTTIYVQPFPATGYRRQLLPKGGQPKHPVWSPDGKQLFYNPGPGQFESVSVTTQPDFGFGNPVAVPRPFPGAPPQARRPYDITPDGRFLSPVAAGQSGRAPQIQVVLNWFEDLRARVPAAK